MKIVNKMKSSATEMMDEPLIIPSQPPIFAAWKKEGMFLKKPATE